MELSVVIPVLNGEQYIGKCIDCISALHLNDDQVEIVVVDNGSTDSTLDILMHKGVKFVVDREATISKLRNIGAANTAGEYVGFVDSDCFVDSEWLQGAKSVFLDNDNIAVVGRYYSMGDEPTWVERVWFDMRKEVEGYVDFLPGGNMMFRRAVFEMVSGFEETLETGEDYNICERVRNIGFKIFNSKEVNVCHMGNFKKLSEIVRKERWYGVGMFGSEFKITKPLLTSLSFLFISIFSIFSIFFDIYIFIYSVIILFLLIVAVACNFSKKVRLGKIKFIIKVLPLAFCYILGRSISVFDRVILVMKKLTVSLSLF